MNDHAQEPATDETLDLVSGSWKLFQLRRGHRFGTDDAVLAWRAAVAAPTAQRVLDLGCGVGSVALQVLSVLPPSATAVGVEAQGVSVSLARRSATLNGLSDRFTIVHGDLRHPDVLDANQTFDLITASPPYFPLGTAMPSREVQRALARMELRGSIVDYAKAARRFAAQAARFAYVMPASDPRTEQAAIDNGWTLLERTEVIFREGRDPLVVVVVCGLAETCSDSICTTRQLTVRDRHGNWTSDYLALRAYFGFEEQ